MKNLHRNLLGFASSLSIGLAMSPVYAQDQGGVREAGLEEIVVTARKKSENMQEVAISVSAVTQSEIERSFSTDIRDLASISPSIIIDDTSQGPGGLASIYIRGIGVSDVEKNFDPAVGVVVDGIFLGQNAGSIARALDLESMEVLRGPQGTVFGRNTIGGVLKLQRTKPTGEFGGKVRASYGNYDTTTLDGLLNFPIGEKIAVKLTGTYSKQGEGYFYNATVDRDQGRKEYTSLGVNVLFNPTEDIELEYTYNRERTDQDQPPILNVGREGDLFCDVFAYCTTGNELPISGDRYVTVMNDEIPGLFDATFDADTHIAELRWDVNEDFHFDYIFGDWSSEETTTGDWDATPETLFHTYRPAEYSQQSHEARLTFDNDGPFSAVAGVYLWDSEYEIRLRSLIGFTPWGLLDIPQTTKQTTGSSAFFFEADYDFSDKLKLTVGGRYGKDEKTTDQSASLVASADVSWNKFTPKVALTYKINDDTMLFGTFSQGYRSGGFNGRVDSDFAATTPYNPETVNNFELGFKADMLDNTLRLNGTIYRMDYKDKQEEIQIPSDGGTGQATVVTNASTARMQGIELDAMLVPMEGLTIRANIGYLDAKYIDFPFDSGPAGVVDFSHLNLRRAPKITSNLSFNYDWDIGEGVATVGAGWHIMGPYDTDFFNKPFLRNPSAQHMISANIGYAIGNAQINVYGRNLAKEDGYTIGFQVADLWAYAAPRNPRTYGVEVNYRF